MGGGVPLVAGIGSPPICGSQKNSFHYLFHSPKITAIKPQRNANITLILPEHNPDITLT